MGELFELIATLFTTRINFVLSVLLASIGFIILLSSAKTYAIVIAIILVITGLVLLIREFRKG